MMRQAQVRRRRLCMHYGLLIKFTVESSILDKTRFSEMVPKMLQNVF